MARDDPNALDTIALFGGRELLEKARAVSGFDEGGGLEYIASLKRTASLHLKIGLLPQKETIVFQPSIFRCYLRFRE